MQLSDLVNTTTGLPAPGREGIVSALSWNVLEALQRFCAGVARTKPYCAAPLEATGLPTGDNLHIAVYSMLLNEYQGNFALGGRVRPPLHPPASPAPPRCHACMRTGSHPDPCLFCSPRTTSAA